MYLRSRDFYWVFVHTGNFGFLFSQQCNFTRLKMRLKMIKIVFTLYTLCGDNCVFYVSGTKWVFVNSGDSGFLCFRSSNAILQDLKMIKVVLHYLRGQLCIIRLGDFKVFLCIAFWGLGFFFVVIQFYKTKDD